MTHERTAPTEPSAPAKRTAAARQGALKEQVLQDARISRRSPAARGTLGVMLLNAMIRARLGLPRKGAP